MLKFFLNPKLTLEQRGFELCVLTYTWIFFQQICVSCYNRTQSVLVLILNAEPQIQRADWEVIQRLCRTLILEFCSSRVNLIRRWASESAWRRNWQPTPVFLLENSMGGGAWQAAVHGVAKSWTRLTK